MTCSIIHLLKHLSSLAKIELFGSIFLLSCQVEPNPDQVSVRGMLKTFDPGYGSRRFTDSAGIDFHFDQEHFSLSQIRLFRIETRATWTEIMQSMRCHST